MLNTETQYTGRFSKEYSAALWMEEIPFEVAAEFVLRHHYSKVMPKQTKVVLGVLKGKEGPLVGIITLGWGVRPKDTIRQLFPSLDSKDYLEIGKLCVHDSEPKNTESRILALTVKWLKRNKPELKVLFTWADAIWGKPGYIYQAANFYYGGYIQTEVYMDKEGCRFHPRQLPAKLRAEGFSNKDILCKKSYCEECEEIHGWRADNEIGSRRPCKLQLQERGWKHFFGLQFRYVYFLTGEAETLRLMEESKTPCRLMYTVGIHGKNRSGKVETRTPLKKSIEWKRPGEPVGFKYPKFEDIKWRVDCGGIGNKPVACGQPKFGESFDPNRI